MTRLLFLLIATLAPLSQALELEDLRAQDQLRISSWLTPETDITVGQEVQLTIEIATPRWFAGGTRIRQPEIPALVIMQRDQFATNLSRREGGDTWVVQRWHLELYPQAAGSYTVPALDVELAVNHASEGIVRGRLRTEPVSFDAAVPAALAQEERWVASPGFSVSQTLEPDTLTLEPGDALQREVVISATHLNSMMLPALEVTAPEGLSAYPETAQLQDRSNRGEATAERRERVTYIVERPGQYLLPEQVFLWWNTETQRLETATLQALRIDAGAAAAGPAQPTAATDPVLENAGRIATWWWLPALLAAALLVLWRLRQGRTGEPREAVILARVDTLLRRGDKAAAARELYHWLNLYRPRPDWYRLRNTAGARDPALAQAVDALLQDVYAANASRETLVLRLRALRGRNGPWQMLRRWLAPPAALEINPGSSSGE